MYGEINMKGDFAPAFEMNEVGTAARLRATQARYDAILAEAREVVALRGFKQGAVERLDKAGVPQSGNINDRLDLALAGYVKPVDPDLLAVRELCAQDIYAFAIKAKTDWQRRKYTQMAQDVRAGLLDDKPMVQNDLRIYKAGKAAKVAKWEWLLTHPPMYQPKGA